MTLRHTAFAMFILFPASALGQGFSEFISSLEATPEADRQAKVDRFLSTGRSFPVVEDSLAHVVYVGEGRGVACPGDMSGWDETRALMKNIAGTNLWFRTQRLPATARLDYKIVRSGEWILDPRNPHTVPGGFGANSELRMRSYVPPKEIEPRDDVPHGKLIDTLFASRFLDNSRKITVYLPPGHSSRGSRYPVVLVHDGLEYLSFCGMQNVIDNLVAEGKLRPVVAVFVPPVDRTPEYAGARMSEFTEFIAKEVMPWVDGTFHTTDDPKERSVMGSSYGGNISLWIAMRHPELFGNVGAFSPYADPKIRAFFRENGHMSYRFYINHGVYDHIPAIHESVVALLPVLRAGGYDVTYDEFPEGHSYGLWRAHLDDALLTFYSAVPLR